MMREGRVVTGLSSTAARAAQPAGRSRRMTHQGRLLLSIRTLAAVAAALSLGLAGPALAVTELQ